MNDDIYGCDYNSLGSVTAKGDISVVSGYDNAKQSISNELLTLEGTYPSVDTDYGSRVVEMLGETVNQNTLQVLTTHINNALLKQSRVKTVLGIHPYISVDKKVKVTIRVRLVDGAEQEYNYTISEE